MRLAGGPTKGADEGSVSVIRASGDVVRARQAAGWFNRVSDIRRVSAESGDTVLPREGMEKSTFVQSPKEWAQILFQLGLGVGGIVSATR